MLDKFFILYLIELNTQQAIHTCLTCRERCKLPKSRNKSYGSRNGNRTSAVAQAKAGSIASQASAHIVRAATFVRRYLWLFVLIYVWCKQIIKLYHLYNNRLNRQSSSLCLLLFFLLATLLW